jgi:hypothetical protein
MCKVVVSAIVQNGRQNNKVTILGHIKLIIWFSGPSASIQMVPHGKFYCHFHKIKIRTVQLHYSGKKIVMGFNFRLIQSISGIESK